MKLVERLLLDIYNDVIPTLSVDEMAALIELKKEIGDKPPNKYLIGQFINLFKELKFIEKYKKLKALNAELKYLGIENISKINKIRVDCVHHDYKASEDEAVLVFTTVKLILKEAKSENSNSADKPTPTSKIPEIDCVLFVGREDQIKEVVNSLLNERVYIVAIDGIGGVGKSTLALEVIKEIKTGKYFDAIIWLSAKKEEMTLAGIRSISNNDKLVNLDVLFNEIFDVFDETQFKEYNFETRQKKIKQLLSSFHTLIVIDNLETIDDKKLRDFLVDNDFPKESKVLITSRERLGQLERVIMLKEFSRAESERYVVSQLEHLSYGKVLSQDLMSLIYGKTGGIPLALKLIVPWIVDGTAEKKLSDFNSQLDNESTILDFCFKKIFEEDLDEGGKRLFCLFASVPDEMPSVARESIYHDIFGKSKFSYIKSVNTLINYSLVIVKEEDGNESFELLPLTKEYGLKKAKERYKDLKDKISQTYLKYMELATNENFQKNRFLAIATAENAKRITSDSKKAESLFDQAIKYDKKCDFVYYLYAIYCKEKADFSKAGRLLEQALELNTRDDRYWIEYSYVLEADGNFQGAEKVLEKAILHMESNINVVRRLVVIKERLSKYLEAIRIAEKYIVKIPNEYAAFSNSKLLIAIMEGYWRLGCGIEKNSHEKAIDYLTKGIDAFDSNKKVIIRRLLLKYEKKTCKKLGQLLVDTAPEKALVYYERSLYTNPDDEIKREHNSYVESKIQKIKAMTPQK